jgi:hypothetical protein
MDNSHETTGAKTKQETDKLTSSEGYTSTEYNSSEDSSNDEFTSDHKHALIQSEVFLSTTNQAVRIDLGIAACLAR